MEIEEPEAPPKLEAEVLLAPEAVEDCSSTPAEDEIPVLSEAPEPPAAAEVAPESAVAPEVEQAVPTETPPTDTAAPASSEPAGDTAAQ